MGIFDKVEQKLEGAVNGVFARAFKGDVQPVEIASRLRKELDSEARLLSRDKRLVPNDFTIHLSRHDFDRLVPYSRTVNAEVIPDLREYASTRHYFFNGPIRINYQLDESLPTGRFLVTSEAVATVAHDEGPATATAIRKAPLVLEVNGVRHPLSAPGFTIGRGSEADLRINDPGVSRIHCRVVVDDEGDDLTVTIEDMDSTNGVVVNGKKVQQARLEDGSRIELGSTRLLVHSPVGQ